MFEEKATVAYWLPCIRHKLPPIAVLMYKAQNSCDTGISHSKAAF